MHAFHVYVVVPLGWVFVAAIVLWLILQFEQHGGGGLCGPYVQGRKAREREAKDRAEYERLRVKYEPVAAIADSEVVTPVSKPGVRSRLSPLAGERVLV